MSHFSPAFIKFFKDLSKNNNTEWFNENRKTYEKEVKKPFASFTDDMIARIGEYEKLDIKASDAIMRINKDIRFSKDKTPYNTFMAANISAFGRKDKSYPGFYFRISHEGISIFGGSYLLEPPSLHKIRTAIVKDPKVFASIYNEKMFKEKFGALQGEKNKKLPPEFQKVAEKEPLVANKQFYYTTDLKPDIILLDNLTDVMMEFYKAGRKMNEYLKAALK